MLNPQSLTVATLVEKMTLPVLLISNLLTTVMRALTFKPRRKS
jgi:hypothetical protein